MKFFFIFTISFGHLSLLAEDPVKPNIIFILADDLGHADVGFNGSTYYETPALDALAETGLVFENAYMVPSCSPSRTALYRGEQCACIFSPTSG